MRIAFCSSEVFPFAKTGGLADVAGALPYALAKAGHTVKVFMPFYKNIKPQKVFGEYGYTKNANVEFYFIKNDEYFMRDFLYGSSKEDYPDNLERFSFFCRQILSILEKINFSPDIIHANDWQTALVNIYLKVNYRDNPFFKNTKCALTIHNLAFQGLFTKDKYQYLGIPWDYFNMHYLEYYDKINLLKGGIIFSDIVNTVSPTYAKQIQTPDYGCGLEGVLREKREHLCGIINAIDYSVWDPAKDKLIYKKYSTKTLAGKYFNKQKLQKDLGLKVDKNTFLIGMVTRLSEQKGVDILAQAITLLLKKYQIVILGFGDEKYHKIFKKTAAKYKKSFSLNLKFDEAMAHRIYGACDAFLMPSRFEPCGLSQMISYKYLSVPLVHATGGLLDTVTDVSSSGAGFVFTNYTSNDLVSCIERAASEFKNKTNWKKLINKMSKMNFSWVESAKKYIEMYKRILS